MRQKLNHAVSCGPHQKMRKLVSALRLGCLAFCRQGRAFGGTAPKADMGQLSQALNEVVDQLRPSQEEQQRQKAAFEQVRSTLVHQWPEAKVHLFGSTANCLSICNNNDIDVCLELPEGIEDQVANAPGLAGMLHRAYSCHSLAAELLLRRFCCCTCTPALL